VAAAAPRAPAGVWPAARAANAGGGATSGSKLRASAIAYVVCGASTTPGRGATATSVPIAISSGGTTVATAGYSAPRSGEAGSTSRISATLVGAGAITSSSDGAALVPSVKRK
jgi:hypothetical protein